MSEGSPCFSCDRDQNGDVPSLLVVLAHGPPRPVCAACFGALTLRVNASAVLGCRGCDALYGAIRDLLAQADRGEQLALSTNPQVPHEPARCLLWPDA